MITTQDAQLHLRYSTWASRKLLDAVMQLPPEQREREMNVSHKGVLETLRHIQMSDHVWLSRVLGEPMQRPEGPIDIEWPRILARWEEWAASSAAANLNRVIAYHDLKGNPWETPLWQIVLHLVNHATLHRGQVMGMMRQVGVAPPPTDLIFFYREQNQK
jgi:uncharacterized damage-inducible protein DinB